jgi:hypothetical protein
VSESPPLQASSPQTAKRGAVTSAREAKVERERRIMMAESFARFGRVFK